MTKSLFRIRVAKLVASMTHPSCWRALSLGVAPTIEHLPLLRKLDVDGVIDVGANRGQFTLACRIAMPTVPVLAFEPIFEEAEKFTRIHGGQNNIVLLKYALGEARSEATLHISRSLDSSSLLPIGALQTKLFPNTAETGTITVPVQMLDDSLKLMVGRQRQLLKLDVQGYELNVLKGAVKTLELCQYVYAECSEVALYEGQSLRPEVTDFLRQFGFHEAGRVNPQFDGSKLIQADYLYSRD